VHAVLTPADRAVSGDRAAKVDGDLVRAYAKYGARIDDGAIDIPIQHNSPRAVTALVEAGVPKTLLVAAALGDDALVAQLLATTAIDHYGDGYTALLAAARPRRRPGDPGHALGRHGGRQGALRRSRGARRPDRPGFEIVGNVRPPPDSIASMRSILLTLSLLLPSCALDEEVDTEAVSQAGSGPGGGGDTPAPPPCQVTSPYQPIRYEALAPNQNVVLNLPAGCTKYFSIVAVGFTKTEVLVFSPNFPLSVDENPDLFVTITDQVPGPASGGCHSVNPPGQPEDCAVPAPGHPQAKLFIKIAVRATTALTNVAVRAHQY
jgi:hypothetical protein